MAPRPVLDCGSRHDRNQPGGTLSEEQIRCREGSQGRLRVGARPRAISIMPIDAGPLPALDMNSNTVFLVPPLPLNRWKGRLEHEGSSKTVIQARTKNHHLRRGGSDPAKVSGLGCHHHPALRRCQ